MGVRVLVCCYELQAVGNNKQLALVYALYSNTLTQTHKIIQFHPPL